MLVTLSFETKYFRVMLGWVVGDSGFEHASGTGKSIELLRSLPSLAGKCVDNVVTDVKGCCIICRIHHMMNF